MYFVDKTQMRMKRRKSSKLTKINCKNPAIKINSPLKNPWKYKTAPITVEKAPKEPKKGQGLGSTKWKGCLLTCTFAI